MQNPIRMLWIFFILVASVTATAPLQAQVQPNEFGLSLRLLSGEYRTELSPNTTQTMYLEVSNFGTNPLTNIELSAELPSDWTISFFPEILENLERGASVIIDAQMTTGTDGNDREYTVVFIAKTDQTSTLTTALFYFDTFSIWQWLGIGVGFLAVAGFVLIYLRFGRN